MKTQVAETIRSPPLSDSELRRLLLKFVLWDSREAFDTWEANVAFDDASFGMYQLLSAAYPKLLKLEIDSRLLVRIKSAHRRTWTENQLLLAALKELFDELGRRQIEFVIAEPLLRIVKSLNDPGIFSLQNFSIAVPIGRKKEMLQAMSGKGWAVRYDSFGRTQYSDGKALDISFVWKSKARFAESRSRADIISFGDITAPILSAEEQFVLLCEELDPHAVDGDSRSLFIAGTLLSSSEMDLKKLATLAREHQAAGMLAVLLESLFDDLGLNIQSGLLDDLRAEPTFRRTAAIRRKHRELKDQYEMFLEQDGRRPSRRAYSEFLRKRWDVNSYRDIVVRGARSCIKILTDR